MLYNYKNVKFKYTTSIQCWLRSKFEVFKVVTFQRLFQKRRNPRVSGRAWNRTRSGFFTTKVMEKLRRYLPEAVFYAMDLTPAMLLVLARKTSEITPFLGVADNIKGSARAVF